MYIWLSLSFALQERCTPILFSCVDFFSFFFFSSFFVINLFDKKINDFVTFGTQIFELWVDNEIKVYRDTFKKNISFWM